MAFFLDERVREACLPAGGGVFTLQGAAALRQSFANAKRLDGTPVQDADITCVTVAQTGIGSATFIATLNLGGTPTLTLSGVAGAIKFSTAGASLPTFDTGSSADVFCTMSVDNMALFDHQGNLLQTALFRGAIIPPDLTDYFAQSSIVDQEAVVAISVENGGGLTLPQKRAKGLAGIFVHDDAGSGTADNIDKFAPPGAASGRTYRAGIKVAPTIRGIVLAAGGVQSILAAPAAGETWEVEAYDEANKANFLKGTVIGHATDPDILNIIERGTLGFSQSGTDVRIRNNAGAPGTFAYTLERKA